MLYIKFKMAVSYDLSYHHPFSLLVYGASGSGKTTSVLEFLKRRSEFMTFPKNLQIHIFYREFQACYKEMQTDKMTHFHKICPTEQVLDNLTKARKPVLLLIDDYCHELSPQLYKDLGCVYRHKNASIIILSQTLFLQEHGGLRCFNQNAQYLWAFSSSRLGSQFLTFARQCSPLKFKEIVQAYFECIKRGPKSFFVADFTLKVPDQLRYRSSCLIEPQSVFLSCSSSSVEDQIMFRSS